MADAKVTTVPGVPPVVPADNANWPVIVAVSLVAVATLGAVVAVALFGTGDSTPIIVTIFGFATTLVTALLAVIKVTQVGAQTAALRVEVNHRLTALVESTKAAATAEGREAGADKERAAAIEATMALAKATALLSQHEAELAVLRASIPTEPTPVTVVPGEPVPVKVVD